MGSRHLEGCCISDYVSIRMKEMIVCGTMYVSEFGVYTQWSRTDARPDSRGRMACCMSY